MRLTNLGLVALLALLMFGTVAAAPPKDTCKGSFTCSMEFGSKGGGKSGSAMNFDGKLTWAKPKLRLDLVEKSTKESMIVLVDFKADNATLLYPDTLNGFKSNLSALDATGYIKQLEPLLSSQGKKLPEGWKRSKVGSEKVAGKAVTKYEVTSPGGQKVYWWVDGSEQPVKVQAGRDSSKATLNFGKLDFGAEVSDKSFSYGKDYAVLDFKGGSAKSGLPK